MPELIRPPGEPKQQLSLFDAVLMIIGIVVGSGIYGSFSLIAQSVGSFAALLGLWATGGIIALLGALCYAELTTCYPSEGGEYVYLARAFGRRMGILFAWAQLWIVRPGSTGAMAFVFAEYANAMVPISTDKDSPLALIVYATLSIVVLTVLNLIGVREGKWTQNLLTLVKVAGLLGIFCVAMFVPRANSPPTENAEPEINYALAMILVMFTYGGWNDLSFIAAEVKNPRRNLAGALLLGVTGITVIYLMTSCAFVRVLGMEGVRNSPAVAADAMQVPLGEWGSRAISGLICISCLGAINGMIFAGARIYYALGREHKLFAPLGWWSPRLGTPLTALVVQAAILIAICAAFGSYEGAGGFQRMVSFTTPVFWTFFFLVIVSLFVLRRRDRDLERPFRVPLYPITPLCFAAATLYMLYASIDYAISELAPEVLWAAVIMAIGLIVALAIPQPQAKR